MAIEVFKDDCEGCQGGNLATLADHAEWLCMVGPFTSDEFMQWLMPHGNIEDSVLLLQSSLDMDLGVPARDEP